MAERYKAVRIPARWRRVFDSTRVERNLTVTGLASQAQVDRKTASGVISGRLGRAMPETVRKLVKGLGLGEEFRERELLAPFGIQLPFRGFHPVKWRDQLGSVGYHVNLIMVEGGLTGRSQQQVFGDVLLPQAVIWAREVHDLV